MRLSQELNDALCEQILQELTNANIYSQVASYFENLQLKNLADYFYKQSLDEKSHADKFIQYINDRIGGKATLGDVQFPNLTLTTPESIGNVYMSTEQQTTASIESLYELALETKSYIDLPFLSDMLSEQVLEEDEAQSFAVKISMVKDLVLFDATFEVG